MQFNRIALTPLLASPSSYLYMENLPLQNYSTEQNIHRVCMCVLHKHLTWLQQRRKNKGIHISSAARNIEENKRRLLLVNGMQMGMFCGKIEKRLIGANKRLFQCVF